MIKKKNDKEYKDRASNLTTAALVFLVIGFILIEILSVVWQQKTGQDIPDNKIDQEQGKDIKQDDVPNDTGSAGVATEELLYTDYYPESLLTFSDADAEEMLDKGYVIKDGGNTIYMPSENDQGDYIMILSMGTKKQVLMASPGYFKMDSTHALYPAYEEMEEGTYFHGMKVIGSDSLILDTMPGHDDIAVKLSGYADKGNIIVLDTMMDKNPENGYFYHKTDDGLVLWLKDTGNDTAALIYAASVPDADNVMIPETVVWGQNRYTITSVNSSFSNSQINNLYLPDTINIMEDNSLKGIAKIHINSIPENMTDRVFGDDKEHYVYTDDGTGYISDKTTIRKEQ